LVTGITVETNSLSLSLVTGITVETNYRTSSQSNEEVSTGAENNYIYFILAEQPKPSRKALSWNNVIMISIESIYQSVILEFLVSGNITCLSRRLVGRGGAF